MGKIKINKFMGMAPAVDETLLPDTASSYAVNCWLYSGALIGLPIASVLRTNSASVTKVYRLPTDYGNATNPLGESTWMEFTNPDTDVVRAPVFGDTHDRYYWASTSSQPLYNTRARIDASSAAYYLGIPAPSSSPTVGTTGGSTGSETRAYTVTFVTAYGEESPPCDPTVYSSFADCTQWDLSAIPTAGATATNRNITNKRIYRTIVAEGGLATYFFVAEITEATTTFTDDLATYPNDVVALNDQLQTFEWTPPPTDLEGFVQMPNGILAGWRNNEIWFSEPYRPHAWPPSYVLTVEYPIVGMGVANQTLVVCTSGYPVTAYGVTPGAITTSTITTFEPCVSRSSILSAPEGVYYASPNGLVLVNSGRAENITRKLITKAQWQVLTKDTKLRAVRLGTAYFAYGTVQAGAFDPNIFQNDAFSMDDASTARLGVFIDMQQELSAFSMLSYDTDIDGITNDPWSGEVFIVTNGNTEWLAVSGDDMVIGPCTWKSKRFQIPYKANMGACKVYFDVPANTPTQSATRDNTLVQTLAADQYGLVRFYFDGDLKATFEMRESGELWRLPSGFRAEYMEVEIETRVKVTNIQIANSVKELAGV